MSRKYDLPRPCIMFAVIVSDGSVEPRALVVVLGLGVVLAIAHLPHAISIGVGSP